MARFLDQFPVKFSSISTIAIFQEDLYIAVCAHQDWSHDPSAVILVVSFNIAGNEIPIYEPLRTTLLELQAEVETFVEAEAKVKIEEESEYNHLFTCARLGTLSVKRSWPLKSTCGFASLYLNQKCSDRLKQNLD